MNRAEREAITAASAAEAKSSKKTADDIIQAAVTANDVEELRGAVVTLAGRVTSLSEALTAVNEIQRRQTETERKTAAIEKEAVRAKEATDQLSSVVIPREEHEERWRQEQEQLIRTRKSIRLQTYIIGTLFCLLNLVALGVSIFIVHGQQSKMADQRRDECRSRLDNSRKGLAAYEQLLTSPTVQHDEALRAFISASRDSALRATKIHC